MRTVISLRTAKQNAEVLFRKQSLDADDDDDDDDYDTGETTEKRRERPTRSNTQGARRGDEDETERWAFLIESLFGI